MPPLLKRFFAFLYLNIPEIIPSVGMAIIVRALMLNNCLQPDPQNQTLEETNCLYLNTSQQQNICFDAYRSTAYSVDCDNIPSYDDLDQLCDGTNVTVTACVAGLISGISGEQGYQCSLTTTITAHAKRVDIITPAVWGGTLLLLMVGSCTYAKFTGQALGQWDRTHLRDRSTLTHIAHHIAWAQEHPILANVLLKILPFIPVATILPLVLLAIQADPVSPPGIGTILDTLQPSQTVCVFQPDYNATMIAECFGDFRKSAENVVSRWQNGNVTFPPSHNEDRTYGHRYGANFGVGYASQVRSMKHDLTFIPGISVVAWLLLSAAVCYFKHLLDSRLEPSAHAENHTRHHFWTHTNHTTHNQAEDDDVEGLSRKLLPTADLLRIQ